MKIGIIRETKVPLDRRVPLTPVRCRELMQRFPDLEITVQPSPHRCFGDEEYVREGIPVIEDLSGCSVLMGVKEVKAETLLEGKTYLFFSHTAKKQPYNRELLRAIVKKGIRLIDYEYLTREDQVRVVAFGRWAGVVGAYNGLRALGIRSESYELPPAFRCKDLAQLKEELRKVDTGTVRIAVTGGGRVAGGATEILDAAGIPGVEPEEYLEKTFGHEVYTRLDPWHYTRHRDGATFDFDHFVAHPDQYLNNFSPYARRTDLYMACHFWDPRSPELLDNRDLQDPGIPIRIIADISCDVNGPIASTIRASTIEDPFYGYDPVSRKETAPFRKDAVTVMAVDNLPGELPGDASDDFSRALRDHVIPELTGKVHTGMLERATIAADRSLTPGFAYLQDYLEGRD
ncbi:MAG: NAD(P)-dependent oxidoreductase [Bacteroidales bacterium]